MLPSRSGILSEAISIAFTSLQQKQSISLASFLQCPHMHQSRFPILIRNKTAAEAYVQSQKQPPTVFCKKSVHKNFVNFTGKHLCWCRFFIKLQVFRPATLFKRDSNTGICSFCSFFLMARCSLFMSYIYQLKIKCKEGGSYFLKNQK